MSSDAISHVVFLMAGMAEAEREKVRVFADSLVPRVPVVDSRPKLTESQKNILLCVSFHIYCLSRPPTLLEICDEFGFSSKNAASTYLRILERKGYLHLLRNRTSRSIVLCPGPGRTCPLCEERRDRL